MSALKKRIRSFAEIGELEDARVLQEEVATSRGRRARSA